MRAAKTRLKILPVLPVYCTFFAKLGGPELVWARLGWAGLGFLNNNKAKVNL
jgi:hypothetical protein